VGRNISFTSVSAVLALIACVVNVSIEHWRNDTDRESRSTGRDLYPSTTWSNTNPTRTGVKINPYLRRERLKAPIVA